MQPNIENNLKEIEEDIKKYSKNGAKLLPVTKTHPVEYIMKAYNLGYRDFGENKVQEILRKKELLPQDINWHLIGHLQTNKVNKIVGVAKLIHSVDSIKLLKKINSRANELSIIQDVLLELNISGEDSKSGFDNKDSFKEIIKEISDLNSISIKGLMTMAPNIEDEEEIREIFKKAKKIFDYLSKISYNNFDIRYLSMGMTNDYIIALQQGANIIRVGSKIFGKRNYDV